MNKGKKNVKKWREEKRNIWKRKVGYFLAIQLWSLNSAEANLNNDIHPGTRWKRTTYSFNVFYLYFWKETQFSPDKQIISENVLVVVNILKYLKKLFSSFVFHANKTGLSVNNQKILCTFKCNILGITVTNCRLNEQL